MVEFRRRSVLFGASLAAVLACAAGSMLLLAKLGGDGEGEEATVVFISVLLPNAFAVLAGSVVGFCLIANSALARRGPGLLTSVLTAGTLSVGELCLLSQTSLVRGNPLPWKLLAAVSISGLWGVAGGALAGRLHGSRGR